MKIGLEDGIRMECVGIWLEGLLILYQHLNSAFVHLKSGWVQTYYWFRFICVFGFIFSTFAWTSLMPDFVLFTLSTLLWFFSYFYFLWKSGLWGRVCVLLCGILVPSMSRYTRFVSFAPVLSSGSSMYPVVSIVVLASRIIRNARCQ